MYFAQMVPRRLHYPGYRDADTRVKDNPDVGGMVYTRRQRAGINHFKVLFLILQKLGNFRGRKIII